MLFYLLRHIVSPNSKTIIFVPTRYSISHFRNLLRHHVEFVTELLRASNFACSSVFGAMEQIARRNNVSAFRNGEVQILIVTDLAARGIGIYQRISNLSFRYSLVGQCHQLRFPIKSQVICSSSWKSRSNGEIRKRLFFDSPR